MREDRYYFAICEHIKMRKTSHNLMVTFRLNFSIKKKTQPNYSCEKNA